MTTYQGAGWACPNCGMFVTSGSFHSCTGGAAPVATRVDPTFQYLALLERAVRALERIAERAELP